MKFWALFPILLLAMTAVLRGQDADPLLRQGDDALAAGLWEMAALHYDESLATKNLTPATKTQLAIRLAEAWVRDGKPTEALTLLGQSFVSLHPAAPFWKGQALLGLGRFTEALATLTPLLENPAAPHRPEAGFTMASLQLALGNPDGALATLAALTSSGDEALTARAQLHEAKILLDLGRSAAARQAMPAASSISQGDRALATFLEAHLLLAEGHPTEAAARFQNLLDRPQGQSLHDYHAAAVGLADALRAAGSPDDATNFLLTFIQGHAESPLLEGLFQRLFAGLADPPALADPVLERLAQWIPPSELTATGAINILESSAATAWPSTTAANSELVAFALFTRAMGLHRIHTPDARGEARRLLNRLRLENPDHFLANRALMQMARWALDEGATERAFGMLDTLRETAKTAPLRGQAAFLEAQSTALQGDKNQAIRWFEEAAMSLADHQAQTARLNAAILRLGSSPGTATPVLQAVNPLDGARAVDLELERALASSTPAAAKTVIAEFLTRHPQHPRVPEARLAAAEAALAQAPPDLAFARSQLDALAAAPDPTAGVSASRLAMVRLHCADLAKDSAAAIAAARTIIEQYPGESVAAEAAYVLGRNLYQTRNYNEARIVLQKLAAAHADAGRAQAAGLLAARSAALVPTTQSQQEALLLFDKVIEAKGSLAAIAMLEKARLMIDMNRLAEASAFLRKWFDALPKTDPLHLPAGLLLGEAIYAQGSINPNSLTEALAVYDQLLVHAEKQPAIFNRLQYLRGRTLEQIPDEKDPSRKREKQAFIAYYSVLETAAPAADWHYFELCGFRALALLEKAERWPAAIACAKRIASFNGTRAHEAATRASQLQLKHMIWEN